MKTTKINAELPSTLGGIAVVIAVIAGLGYYFYSTSKVPAQEVAATEYPTGVLEGEFDADGVFMKVKSLTAPGGGPVVAATPVIPSIGEVGKTDLGAIE